MNLKCEIEFKIVALKAYQTLFYFYDSASYSFFRPWMLFSNGINCVMREKEAKESQW